MFGMEKKKSPSFMAFDLEKEINDDKKQKQHVKHAEKMIAELKKQLREGASNEEFENLGFLLHGYSALLKILNRVTT